MKRLDEHIRTLNPAHFAMVMATGIVSIACQEQGMKRLAESLVWLNVAMFTALWLASGVRAVRHPRDMWEDLADHKRGAGFFTMPAATCVLGAQLILVAAAEPAAAALWWLGAALWGALTYAVFTAFTVKEVKPPLAEGINGGWLVAVVATQSVANLGVLLDARFGAHRQLLLFACLTLWLTGGMLYIWMISLVFYRYTFFQFPPSDLSPPYWINMGAMAISTLTGTALIRHAAEWSFLERLLPFLHGFTLFFWGTATWWIPMLVILGVWRHVYKRFRITYDPLYWGGVFPLGMYGACTYRLAQVSGIGELTAIARLFSFAALAAWAAASFGLVRSLWRNYYAHAIGAGVGELVA